MFNKFFLFCFITFTIISKAQTVILPGDVSGTWEVGGSPYEIQGEITIPYGLALTIEPGVLVEFQGYYKLNVQGSLLAIGTETDTITFTINDTTGFHDPNIPDGGWHGVRFIYNFSNDSSKIIYCKLEYGKAVGPDWQDYEGGAICVYEFSKLFISNCLFDMNMALGGQEGGIGGAIRIDNSSNIILSNCTISRNSARIGGGIMVWGNSNIQIINCTIVNNHAINVLNGGIGGGICSFGENNLLIKNNVLNGNTATFGGGINFYETNSLLSNNIIVNNQTLGGGGILFNGASNVISINNTICNNNAEGGGGITCGDNSDPILINTILYGNTASLYPQIQIWDIESEPSFYYCDIEDGIGTHTGSYNIDSLPLFVNATADDFRLTDYSPCIGVGIDSIEIAGVWYYVPSFCIEGNPRPNPAGSMPDIGACENHLGAPVDVEQDFNLTKEFALQQNYPNPFNPITTINYQIPELSFVTIKVYDVLGNEVAVLVKEEKTIGSYEIEFDGSALTSGVYFYTIKAGEFIQTKKMVLLR